MEPILLITGLLVVIAVGIFMLVLSYQKRQSEYFRERERLQQRFEKEMLENELEIKEQTLREVSQELHDNVAQVLTMAKLNLNAIGLYPSNQASEKIDIAKDYITGAIQDLRDLSKTMNADFFARVGLEHAINEELRKLEKVGTIITSFQSIGDFVEIDPKKEIILFRIIQEAIQNVVKHAGASLLGVTVSYFDNNTILSIKDDGKGFLMGDSLKGNGLINIESRCKVIGAVCHIESRLDGSGTCITICLPNTLGKKPGARDVPRSTMETN